jgi:hypothetical protein
MIWGFGGSSIMCGFAQRKTNNQQDGIPRDLHPGGNFKSELRK